MPELPDVEIFRQYFQSTSLHQPVAEVNVSEPGMLQSLTPAVLGRYLHGKTFISAVRHGKYLLSQVQGEGWLVLHFGMTGFLHYGKNRDDSGHVRLTIHFNNGYRLDFDCQRKLGRIAWADSVEKFIEENDLGPDPFQKDFSAEVFRRILQEHGGYVKSILMNQQALAGIGNIYSDEILFHAGIHPRRKVSDLTEEEGRELYRCLNSVLQSAIDCRVGEKGWPDDWLLPRRGGGACPRCGGMIERMTIGGRHAWFCPKHQN
jgi:formamidopyrimidine-DNA glycosylase